MDFLFAGDLEGKVKWLHNFQKVKLLRDALVWTPVWERDKRAFIPEVCQLSELFLTLMFVYARVLLTEQSADMTTLVFIFKGNLISVIAFLLCHYATIRRSYLQMWASFRR